MKICPKCKRKMKQSYHQGYSLENPMTCEEVQECECGVTYEFSYGAERFLDKNGKKIKAE